MKRNVIFKRFLPMLLFVLGLCVTSTYAQQDANATPPGQSTGITYVDDATALQNIMAEITSLKSSLGSITQGSGDYVDAVRRIEVFAASAAILEAGETAPAAYRAGVKHLHYKIEAKEVDQPKLKLIQQTLTSLITN